jgi:hypothetical protein
MNSLLHRCMGCLGELHLSAALASGMEDGTDLNRPIEHLFQTHGLSSQLQIVIDVLVSFAMFVFNRIERSIRPELHNVTLAYQAQCIAPDRQCVFDARTRLAGGVGCSVHTSVLSVATLGVNVVLELAVDVNQGTSPRAVGVLIQRGDIDWVDRLIHGAHPTTGTSWPIPKSQRSNSTPPGTRSG